MALELVPTMDTSLTYGFESSQIDELSKPLNQALIKERPGPGGKALKYITGKTAIDTANHIFGIGKWGYRVLNRSREVVGDKEFYTADVELYVLGCPFPFPGEGEGIPLFSTPAEHAKARKEAVTDALKRALRHFGDQFGLCLYDEDALVEDSNGNLTQVKNVHPQNGKQSPAKKTVEASAPQSPLDKAKTDAYKIGFITGKSLAELKASWEEQVIQIFGSLLSEQDLSKPHNLARINGKMEEYRRQKTAVAAK